MSDDVSEVSVCNGRFSSLDARMSPTLLTVPSRAKQVEAAILFSGCPHVVHPPHSPERRVSARLKCSKRELMRRKVKGHRVT